MIKKVQKYFCTISKHNFLIACDISTDCACTLLNKDASIMEKKLAHARVCSWVTSMIFLGRVWSNLPSCSQWEMSSWNTSQAAWATALFSNWTNKQGGGETRQERINDAQEISFFFFYVDQLCEERSDVKPAFSSRRKKTQHKTAA